MSRRRLNRLGALHAPGFDRKRWSRWWFVTTTERSSGTIGLITLDVKRAGARTAGNPHAACEVAGIGNGITDVPTRARWGKPRIQTREVLRITAPVLDPTAALNPKL